MPKVSVIVPVYGVEKYIERCARSLFEQTLDDIEYIFVDDCTPDCSIDILKALIEEYRLRFAEMNYKVRIERMPTNSGLPAVRRHGIQLATGDYIIHCDSDDWVDRDMYRQMYEKAVEEGADMVVCNHYIHNGETVVAEIQGCFGTERIRFLKDLLFQKNAWSVWNKMVRRGVYDMIKYYPSGAMGEDMVLTVQLVYNSKSIAYISKPLYYYYSNASSITHQADEKSIIRKVDQNLNNFDLVLKFLEQIPEYSLFLHGLDWIRYAIKSMLNVNSKTIIQRRKHMFPGVEYRVLFYEEISAKKKKEVVKTIIKNIFRL